MTLHAWQIYVCAKFHGLILSGYIVSYASRIKEEEEEGEGEEDEEFGKLLSLI